MSGTIQLSLTQQFDYRTREPLAGGQISFYRAGTVSTPQSAYYDADLTLPFPNPYTLQADGRIPQFFLADGSIKVVLIAEDGTSMLNADNILVIGPSGGGGGGGTVDPTTVLQTGQVALWYGTGTRTGFVRANGRTIGSATSGATELANASAQALFLFLWGEDANLVVSTGRGVSAAADWAANKTIAMPDFRGRVPAGFDDMGNAAAGRLTAAGGMTGTGIGSVGGAQTETLTLAQLPTGITVAGTGAITPSIRYIISDELTTTFSTNAGGATSWRAWNTSAGVTQNNPTIAVSATSNNTSGSAHITVQPTIFVTLYMKL